MDGCPKSFLFFLFFYMFVVTFFVKYFEAQGSWCVYLYISICSFSIQKLLGPWYPNCFAHMVDKVAGHGQIWSKLSVWNFETNKWLQIVETYGNPQKIYAENITIASWKMYFLDIIYIYVCVCVIGDFFVVC